MKMAWIDCSMSILDLVAMASAQSRSGKLPYFVSTQVTEARRYFLELATKPGREIVVVCGGCERVGPDYLVDRSTFPFLVVEFVAEGAGSLELAGRRYRECLRGANLCRAGTGTNHEDHGTGCTICGRRVAGAGDVPPSETLD